jgi:hypothetical protein
MKKVLLVTLALAGIFSLFAQKNMGIIPARLKNQTAIRIQGAVDLPISPIAVKNPYVSPQPNNVAHKVTGNSVLNTQNALAVSETQIGNTVYDLQTNSSVQNRLFVYPDGTIGATFTYGQNDFNNFPDRGTGYNYFNGSAWGAQPTARIETARCGWPSYCPFGTNGELIVSHNSTTGLLISKRTTKGTGTWTHSTLVGPTNSGGTTALLWSRTITSGNTIHIIACTDQAVAPAVYTYQGLKLALVYIRSTNGGTTWDAPRILPGMDSASIVTQICKGFDGDTYAWALPKGDTIAFVVGKWGGGLFIEKSTNGGNTWTKIPVYTFPTITSFPTPTIPAVDGSLAIALDNGGNAHVCSGRMKVKATVPDSTFYFPYTDGLIYWHEGMPVIDTATLSNDAALSAAGNLIGYMHDWNGDDTINFPVVGTGQFPFGQYWLSLSSMPQIAIDGNNVYVTYSSVMETKTNPGANPNEQLYRHILYTNSNDGGNTWDSVTVDLNSDVSHDYDECVFGSLAVQGNNLHMVYQADSEPGLAVRGDLDSYGANNIYYMTWSKLPLPTAGNNGPVCVGSTISLTASTISGATYSWTGPNGFSSQQQNPTVSASSTIAMSGIYYVTAIVGGISSPTCSTTVVVNPIPSAPTAGNNGPACVGSALSLTASNISGATYSWIGPNGYSSSSHNPTVSASATTAMAGTYNVTATVNGCTGSAGSTTVTINPIPSAPTAGNNGPVCFGSTLSLSASTISGATYSWSGPNGFSSTLQNPTVSGSATSQMSGTYHVHSILNGCSSVLASTTVIVNSQAPTEDICYVEFDTITYKNSINWTLNLPVNVDSLHIYNEVSLNVWNLIGSEPASQNHFIDLNSNPFNQSYSYKITTIDTCGNESNFSAFHTTITLLAAYDQGTNTYGFTWSAYQGLTVSDYYLYGITAGGTETLIGSVPGNQYFYNYTNPSLGFIKYFVGFNTPLCTSKTNHLVKSNYVQAPTGIEEKEGINNLVSVYPNPVTDNLQIQTALQIKNIEITDITGRLLYTTTSKIIDCRGFAKGVYFVRVETAKGVAVKKIIEQ